MRSWLSIFSAVVCLYLQLSYQYTHVLLPAPPQAPALSVVVVTGLEFPPWPHMLLGPRDLLRVRFQVAHHQARERRPEGQPLSHWTILRDFPVERLTSWFWFCKVLADLMNFLSLPPNKLLINLLVLVPFFPPPTGPCTPIVKQAVSLDW